MASKIKLNIDPVAHSEKPKKEEFGLLCWRIAQPTSVRECTIEELAQALERGHTISVAHCNGGTKEENFVSSDIVGLDFDDTLSLEEVTKRLKSHQIVINIAYPTFSCGEKGDRFRVITKLDERITDKETYKQIVKGLQSLFTEEETDKATQAPTQRFHGTNKKCFIVNDSAETNTDLLLMLYEDNVKPIEEEARKKEEAKQLEKKSKYVPNLDNGEELQSLVDSFDLETWLDSPSCPYSFNKIYKRSGTTFYNPSPVGQGTNDNFCVTGQQWCCFAEDGIGQQKKLGGGIIELLEHDRYNSRTKKEAIDYFKYKIMGLSEEEDKKAYREAMEQKEIAEANEWYKKQKEANENNKFFDKAPAVESSVNDDPKLTHTQEEVATANGTEETQEVQEATKEAVSVKENKSQIIISELTSESIFEERVFLLLLGMKDKIKRTRTEQQLFKQAEKLGVRKDFEQLLKTYKEVEKENAEKKKKKTRKEPFTIEALEEELEQRKITLKHNSITNELTIYWNNSGFHEEDKEATLPTLLRSELCDKYTYCNKDSIYDYLSFIAKKNRFNPVLDVLNANKWDKKDRIQELFEILHLEEDDKLSRTLIIKWLWQGLALLENSIEKSKQIDTQGVLTLTGSQGIGKTTFFRQLATLTGDCAYFQDGMRIDSHDKDCERRCVTTWIAELGELDTTFKSDIGALKSFITRPLDKYRLPYARSDETVPRRTNICATVNGDYFLIDQTGNRRFWTVPVTEIDINRIKEFDSLQLWEQIKEQYYLSNKRGFFLTKEEQNELEERNNKAMKPTKGQEEVADIINRIKENPKYVLTYMTVTEFQSLHKEILGRYSVSQIGVALTALGYPKINMRRDGVPTYCRELPSLEGVPFKETDKKKNFYSRA